MKIELSAYYARPNDPLAEHYSITYNTKSLLAKAEVRAGWMHPNQFNLVHFETDDQTELGDVEVALWTALDNFVADTGMVRLKR